MNGPKKNKTVIHELTIKWQFFNSKIFHKVFFLIKGFRIKICIKLHKEHFNLTLFKHNLTLTH